MGNLLSLLDGPLAIVLIFIVLILAIVAFTKWTNFLAKDTKKNTKKNNGQKNEKIE